MSARALASLAPVILRTWLRERHWGMGPLVGGWLITIGLVGAWFFGGAAALAGQARADCHQDACESALPEYAQWLHDGGPEQRTRALGLLARLGTGEAAALLRPIAAEPGPEQALAIAGLAFAGQARDADRWLAGLRSADPAVRQTCVWAAGALMDASAQRPLLLMLQGAEPSAQVALLDAIGLAGLSELFVDVAAAGRSDSKAVRAASLRALAGMPLVGANLLWQDRLRTEKDSQVRTLGAAALGPPRDGGGKAWLQEGMQVDALASLAKNTKEPVGRRAEAAFRWMLLSPGHAAAPDTSLWPAWVKRGLVLGRMVAGHLQDSSALERQWRQVAVGRWAHPALRRPADEWLVEKAWGAAPQRFRYEGAKCPAELAPARE